MNAAAVEFHGDSQPRPARVAGGGIENAVSGNLSLKLEYLHADFAELAVQLRRPGGRALLKGAIDRMFGGKLLEATPGIEPGYTVLQTVA